MPSEKVLEAKKAQVAAIKEYLDNSVAGVLVNYSGISVADDTALRKELREAGVYYAVIKNTLLRRAFADSPLSEMDEVLNGTTAIALSKEDHTAAARILSHYAENHENFSIKAGILDGKAVDVATVDALAKLPTRDALLSTVCCAFNAPIASLARVLQAVVDKKPVEA